MNNEQLLKNFKTTLLLEWYGIRMEESEEVGYTTHQYISVPESSTIEVKDPELNTKVKTADGLISIAKDMLVKMLLDSCQSEFNDDEFTQEVKDNISEYLKVYAKVRKGEVWTEDMSDARLKEIEAKFKQAMEYEEI